MEADKITSIISEAFPTVEELEAMSPVLEYKSVIGDEIRGYISVIASFIQNHNKMPEGNCGYINETIIEGWANLQSVLLLVFEKLEKPDLETVLPEGKLIGMVLAFLVPVLYGEETPTKPAISSESAFDGINRQSEARSIRNLLKNGRALPMTYTTFNCIHTDYRKRGLGKDIIVKLKQIGVPLGIQHGYHILPGSMYPALVKIKQWMRPINPTKVRKLGFKIPDMEKILSISKATKSRDRGNRRGQLKLKACLSKAKAILITDDESNSSYEEYLAFSSDFKLRYAPSKKHWRRFVQNVPTYRVMSGDETVGLFSAIQMSMVLNLNGNSLTTVNIVMAVGNTKDIITAGIKLCENIGALVLYANEVGSLKGQEMDKMFCLETKHVYSFLTYNLKAVLGAADICLPIF